MAYDRRPSPDGDTGPTGTGDPYLANLAHQSHTAAVEGPSVAPDNSVGLNGSDRGSDRGSDAGACYDPYLVEVARSIRPDF